MFKKLKEKITEEVKSSPQRLQQFLQQQQQTTAASTDDNFFSLSEDDAIASPSTMETGFTNVSLMTSQHQRSRRNSNSSIASDVSFLPRYESSSNVYHLQSDFEVSASEMEDNASTSSQLGHLTKEQIYSAFQKAQKQHHKYRGRYVDLARHYKELERENAKMKSVLVETQDKAIRRVAELKEQCSLEQKAKAHLENALRVELDERQYKIETLQTQIGLLHQQNHAGDVEDHSTSPQPTENGENLELLRKYLNDARAEIENLNAKLQEMKANTIVFQSKENDYKNRIATLEKEIAEHSEREKENNLNLAQNKMELHNELLAKDTEISKLKVELETLKQPKDGKLENLQTQNKKLIEKVENLTHKCNGYEGELLKMEQYKIEIKTLGESVADLRKSNTEIGLQLQEKNLECDTLAKTLQSKIDEERKKLEEGFEARLTEQRESAKKALLSLETRIKDQVTAEHAEKEEKIRAEFLQRIENLTTNQDNLKDLQTKLFEQEDLNQNLQQEVCSLNERLHNLQAKYKELEDNHLELIKEASDQRNKITELNKELEETRNTNNGFEDEVSRLTANLRKFQDVLNKVKTEKQQVVDEKTQLESELNTLKQEICEKVSDYEELSAKFETLQVEISNKTELAKQLEELQSKYVNALDENQNLKENFIAVEQLQKQISDLEGFKLKSEENVRENETLGVQVAELESKLQEYKDEMEKGAEEVAVVRNELKEKLSENERLQEQFKIEQRRNAELEEANQKAIVNLTDLSEKLDKMQAEIVQLKEMNGHLSTDNTSLSNENSGLLNELSETKIKLDLAQIEVTNYKEIADKIASEKQLLLEENNNLKADFEKEKQEFLKASEQVDVNELKEQINQLQEENKQFKEQVERLQCLYKEQSDLQGQLKELEHQYGEILHEKQLLQDEVQELKTAPLNLNKLDNLKLLQTDLPSSKQYEQELNELHEKLIQYQSMELTNKSSIEFYQSEVEKLKIKNEKLNRKLDETLVTLNHCAELSNSTEIEYLRNVLFNYMLGKESVVLARVIAAVCKFDDQQTEMIMQKEQQRQSLLGHLGIL